jgi:hypothetical protein
MGDHPSIEKNVTFNSKSTFMGFVMLSKGIKSETGRKLSAPFAI